MLAIVPILILAGGLTVGAFNATPLDQDNHQVAQEKNEMTMTAEEIAALEPFPYE